MFRLACPILNSAVKANYFKEETMRELTEQEAGMVFGGDGIVLPGGNYISTTRTVLNGFGIMGAVSAGFAIGDTIGNGINYGYEMATGGSLAHDAGHWLYNNS